MRTIVNGRVAATIAEFAELALGIDWALFDGEPGETEEERAARLAAARDILADLWSTDRKTVKAVFGALWAVDTGTAVCAALLLGSAAVEPAGAIEAREELRAA